MTGHFPIKTRQSSNVLAFVFACAVVGSFSFAVNWGVARHKAPDHVFLGFTQRDVPLYYAYARAVFERGNGLLYPNPYEWERKPDVIYCQLFFVLCGWLWRLGIPFTALDQILRVVCGVGMLLALWRLLGRFLPSRHTRWPAYACLSLCAGTAWIAALVATRGSPHGFMDAFIRMEKGYQCFFFVWRQLFLATECFYHCLSFYVFWAVARGRFKTAYVLLWLTWWSHPFTGLETGAIAALFLTFALMAPRRRREDWLRWGAVVGADALWCAYYGPFLNSFESHKAMMELWMWADLRVFWDEVAMGQGLWIALAAPALFFARFRRWVSRTRPGRLWLAWLMTTAALMSTNRLPFLKQPSQPIHFDRGYLFVPLVVAAVWSMRLVWGKLRRNVRRLVPVTAAAVFAITLPDNGFLLWEHLTVSVPKDRVSEIPRADWEVIEWFEKIARPSRVAVVEALPVGGLDYLLPTFTPHITALGHLYNTTHYKMKRLMLKQYWLGESDELLRRFDPDYLVQPNDRASPRREGAPLQPVFRNAKWSVFAMR